MFNPRKNLPDLSPSRYYVAHVRSVLRSSRFSKNLSGISDELVLLEVLSSRKLFENKVGLGIKIT